MTLPCTILSIFCSRMSCDRVICNPLSSTNTLGLCSTNGSMTFPRQHHFPLVSSRRGTGRGGNMAHSLGSLRRSHTDEPTNYMSLRGIESVGYAGSVQPGALPNAGNVSGPCNILGLSLDHVRALQNLSFRSAKNTHARHAHTQAHLPLTATSNMHRTSQEPRTFTRGRRNMMVNQTGCSAIEATRKSFQPPPSPLSERSIQISK